MTITGNTTSFNVTPSTTGITPTYNETIIVMESPNVICDNFKWVVDLYVRNEITDLDELISTLEILPNPDGYGVFDVHRHIENYISSTFYPSDLEISLSSPESHKRWSIRVTETFQNPRWRYDDYIFTPNVGFTTDGFSNQPHPFVDGDVVSVQQDPGFLNPTYNVSATTVTVIDDLTIDTTIPWVSGGTTDPGLITLVSGGTRNIQQVNIESSGWTSFNGVINYDEFFDFDSDVYNMRIGDVGRYLTDLPDTYTCDRDSHIWLSIYGDSLKNGIQITTDNGVFFYSLVIPAFDSNLIKQVKVGPKDILNTTSPPTVISGSLPVIDDNTTFIQYQIVDGSPGLGYSPVSFENRLNLVDRCSRYEKYQFLFLDKLGSYIPVWFNLVSKKKKNVNKKNYSQNYGRYDSVANTWGYTTYDRGIKTYDMQVDETVTVTSDWLNTIDNNLVQIMLTSPEVYHIDENGVFRAINITTTSYDVKERQNDKLINYTISFEYALKNRTQRG